MRIKTPLTPSQRSAVQQLRRLRVGALYIEKGAGKIRTVLELIRLRMDTGKVERVIWLCPCSMLKDIRQQIRTETGGEDHFLLLCGIETLSHSLYRMLRLQAIAQSERTMLVADGGEMIRNPQSLRTQRVQYLSQFCPYRLLVSEVPLTRSVEDMYTQWRLLDWRILGYQSFWSFSINHLSPDVPGPGRRVPQNVDYLLRRIRPYTCRLTADDNQLSGKRTEYTWKFRLTEEMMTYYRTMIQHFLQRIHLGGTEVYRMILACQQMASGRCFVSLRPLISRPLYKNPLDNPRIQALLQVLQHFPDQRVLVLCRFSYEVQDVMAALRESLGQDSCKEYTRACSKSVRPPILVMNRLCSSYPPSSCGADIIIHYSHDWDWEKRYQSERHAHEAASQVISLVAVNTIDIRILECLRHKQNLVQLVQNGLNGQLPEEETEYAENLQR